MGSELKGVALNAEYAKKLTEEQVLDVKKRAMEVVSGLQIKKLNEILTLLADYSFNDPQKKYLIIIDQLDENWAENETRYKFIRALIEEIKVFRKIKNIKIIVALRLDLLRSVFNLTRGSGFQEEKYESYILDIKWTPEQLTELVQKRVSEVYRRQYTRENVKIQDIFPRPKGGPTGLTPLEYIIERTLLRSRDVLQYVNECFSIALERERISWGTIQKAESAYSQKRLRSLKEEWGDIYPSFEETVEILRNLPDRFTRNDILRSNIDAVITELSVQGTHDPCAVSANKMLNGENREADVINEILLCVYNLGIVGFKVSSLTPYKWSFRDSTPTTKNEIKRASGMKIHKMLHSALDVRINAEKRFEKEKEESEDEADND
ncbi:P-loop ATPase, Sll1717 family [Escherichia coli]|uniref:P-loop ATPase, Sll1717 family n=1 Tax=Escherichia coli TaxID=562 RepID=UPI003D7F78C4